MSERNKPGPPELKELMGRVLESDASQAFGEFMERRVALGDMAPAADDAVIEGIEESPDGGAAMAERTCSACRRTSARSSSSGPPCRPAGECTPRQWR